MWHTEKLSRLLLEPAHKKIFMLRHQSFDFAAVIHRKGINSYASSVMTFISINFKK